MNESEQFSLFSVFFSPISLTKDHINDENYYYGKKMYIGGFGQTEMQMRSTIKKIGHVYGVNSSECQAAYALPSMEKRLCAYDRRHYSDACHGIQ